MLMRVIEFVVSHMRQITVFQMAINMKQNTTIHQSIENGLCFFVSLCHLATNSVVVSIYLSSYELIRAINYSCSFENGKMCV